MSESYAERMKRRSRMHLIWFLRVLCGIAVFVLAVYLLSQGLYRHSVRTTYQQALTLAEEGDYEQAADLLDDIQDAKLADLDIKGLTRLCSAHMKYDAGNSSGAYLLLKNVTLTADSDILQQDFSSFLEILTQESEEREAAAEAEKIAKANEIPEVPYVGMLESRVSSTTLGYPSAVRHNQEMISGKPVQANLYDFKQNGVTIFIARCVQGWVTQVWDWRDRDTSGTASSGSSSKKSSSSKSSDPYNASNYKDAEDFYYDNYEDFDNWDDAEIYWDQNH